ncbi:MAG: hypothetical protein QOE70_3811 [Chthoniobacter sp.]|nr:hypothetical protein [Chthoniobacter sp.]
MAGDEMRGIINASDATTGFDDPDTLFEQSLTSTSLHEGGFLRRLKIAAFDCMLDMLFPFLNQRCSLQLDIKEVGLIAGCCDRCMELWADQITENQWQVFKKLRQVNALEPVASLTKRRISIRQVRPKRLNMVLWADFVN